MSSTDSPFEVASHGQTASRAVLGRGSLFTIGTAAPILAQIVVTPFVTRLLGPSNYGLVAQALVVVQVTMMLASFGMPSVITRHALMTENGLPRARSVFIRACGITLLLGCLTASAAVLIFRSSDAMHQLTWMFAVLAGTGFVLTENGQALLRATDRPLAFVAVSGITMLGGPVLGLSAIAVIGRSPAAYIGGLAIGYLLAGAVGAFICLGIRLKAEARYESGDMRYAFELGLPMVPHMVALYLLAMSVIFVSGHLYGVGASGRIQLAVLLGTAPNVITGSLNNSWAPTIFATPEDRRGEVLEHTATDIATVAALISGGVALLSPWLLRIVASAAYKPDQLVPAACVVALGSMLSVGYLANVQLIFASGHPRWLSVVTPCSLLVGLGAAIGLGHISFTWIASGFPTAYLVLSVGVAVLRRHVGAPRWRESRLLKPFGIGAALILLGAVWPTHGWIMWLRWPMAGVAGTLLLLAIRRVFRAPVRNV